MELTKDQIRHCKIVVAGMVKYQESYEELTDHVLTAMENLPPTPQPYYEVLDQVINNDFGSKDNIAALEKQREKIVLKRLQKRQWQYVLQHFKIPLIGFTIFLAVVSYFAVGTYIKPRIFVVLLTLIVFCPLLILLCSEIRRMIKKPKSKRSVKESMFYTNGYFAMTIFNMINFIPQLFTDRENYHILLHANVVVLTVVIVFFTVYTLSFIKLYQEELKMQLV